MPNSLTLKELFDRHFEHVRFDNQLAADCYHFQVGVVHKSDEHMKFFGGNLLGCYALRFMERDVAKFFDEVAGVDPDEIARELPNVKAINMSYEISSDIFNQTVFYMIHRFLTTNEIKNHQVRLHAAYNLALIFNYRCVCALATGYFKYPPDVKTAEAVYANLSNQFILKKLGTWQALMNYRADEITKHDGLHNKTLIEYTNDKAIIEMINDCQGRIRGYIKSIYGVLVDISASGGKIHTSSNLAVNADGVEVIKDKVHNLEIYTGYILSTVPDRNAFVKPELINIVAKTMYTMQIRGFTLVLEWMSDNFGAKDCPEIEQFVTKTMEHSFEYLSENGSILKNTRDLAGMLTKLKGFYTSSRTSDEGLLELRDIGTSIVNKAVGKSNEQAIAAIRTGLMLYVCLRAYTKKYYGG